MKVPQKTLTAPHYADGLRSTIHRAKAMPSDLLPGEPTPFLEHDETTHFSIIDGEGNEIPEGILDGVGIAQRIHAHLALVDD